MASYKKIKLYNGLYTLVDSENFKYYSKYKLSSADNSKKSSVNRHYQVIRCEKVGPKKWKNIIIAREIMNCPKGLMVDHINGNGLDNRKSNLRICTNSQNSMNKPNMKISKYGYKGIVWLPKVNKYLARIKVNGKEVFGKVTTSKIQAARDYDSLARRYFGEFSHTNFK